MNGTTVRFFVLSAAAHAALLSFVFHSATPPRVQMQADAPMTLSLLAVPPVASPQNEISAPPAVHRTTDTPSSISPRPIPAMTPVQIARSGTRAPSDTAVMNETAPPSNADAAATSLSSSSTQDKSADTDHTAEADDSLAQQLVSRVRDALGAYFSYPPLAKRQGWQGEVKVGLRVYADGRLSDIHLVASSGHGILDRAALRSLAQVQHLDGGTGWLDGGHFDMVLPIQYRLIDG